MTDRRPRRSRRIAVRLAIAAIVLGHMVAFKPRFELGEDGWLVLVPCPVSSLAELSRVVHDQEEFFRRTHTCDFWVGRSPSEYLPRESH